MKTNFVGLLIASFFLLFQTSCLRKENEAPAVSASPLTPATLNKVDDDGGWSSSGGGEFVVDRQNPWFMGKQEVKWCLNHGGKENFSLGKVKSKIEIEKGMNSLIKQLKAINSVDTFRIIPTMEFYEDVFPTLPGLCGYIPSAEEGWEYTCEDKDLPLIRSKGKFISENYRYTENCEEADLEFILGNINDPKIKRLIEDMGTTQFENMVGVSMRTGYSFEQKWGKGFIYIAADTGDLEYEGARTSVVHNKTIWDKVENLKDEQMDVLSFAFDFSIAKKEEYVSALRAVVAHEFGHTLGFSHNFRGDLMDQDYPAIIANAGFFSQKEFEHSTQIFSRALLGIFHIPYQLNFRWAGTRDSRIDLSTSQAIRIILTDDDVTIGDIDADGFEISQDDLTSEADVIHFEINPFPSLLESDETNGYIHFLQLARRRQYGMTKKLPAKIKFCREGIEVGSIQNRSSLVKDQEEQVLNLNQATHEWELVWRLPEKGVVTTGSHRLVPLWENQLCGEFKYLGDNIKFKLDLDYYGKVNKLHLTEEGSDYTISLQLFQPIVTQEELNGLPEFQRSFLEVMDNFKVENIR